MRIFSFLIINHAFYRAQHQNTILWHPAFSEKIRDILIKINVNLKFREFIPYIFYLLRMEVIS